LPRANSLHSAPRPLRPVCLASLEHTHPPGRSSAAAAPLLKRQARVVLFIHSVSLRSLPHVVKLYSVILYEKLPLICSFLFAHFRANGVRIHTRPDRPLAADRSPRVEAAPDTQRSELCRQRRKPRQVSPCRPRLRQRRSLLAAAAPQLPPGWSRWRLAHGDASSSSARAHRRTTPLCRRIVAGSILHNA
jgi:hypothetical protein